MEMRTIDLIAQFEILICILKLESLRIHNLIFLTKMNEEAVRIS